MNNETLEFKKDALVKLYKEAKAANFTAMTNLLEKTFGEAMFNPKDVTERIKTFHDAYCELGNEHPFVLAYEKYVNADSGEESDIIAYLKLRIIVAALNEGWTPQFIPGEYRWSPYFVLYTKDEYEQLSDEAKARVVYRANYNAYALGGGSYASANYDAAYVSAHVGSRLAFKSEELAVYAGKQFIDIYADYLLWPKNTEE